MGTAPVFASAGEALDMVHAGLAFLAAADATAMGAAERASCLRRLEQADSVATAVRTSVLGAFAAGAGYTDDGEYNSGFWGRGRAPGAQGTPEGHNAGGEGGGGGPPGPAAPGL